MLCSVVLLAQVATATPAPTQTPAPVVGAAAPATRSAVPSGPKTLSDIARERKLGKKGVTGGTLSVAGAPLSSARLPAGPVPPIADPSDRVQAARANLAAAEADLRRAENTYSAVSALPDTKATLNALSNAAPTGSSVVDPTQENTLSLYRARVAEAKAKLDAVSAPPAK